RGRVLVSCAQQRNHVHVLGERVEGGAGALPPCLGDPRRAGAVGRFDRRIRRAMKSGAFGTGSWTDTSPHNGCRIATMVAIGELAANAAASNSSLTVVSAWELAVPVRELVDFVRYQAAVARAPSIRNKEEIHAHTAH